MNFTDFLLACYPHLSTEQSPFDIHTKRRILNFPCDVRTRKMSVSYETIPNFCQPLTL